jgi:guanyl-specific ribonuclease Sa
VTCPILPRAVAVTAVAVAVLLAATGCGPGADAPIAPEREPAPRHKSRHQADGHHPKHEPQAGRHDRPSTDGGVVPSNVLTTLRYIDEHHRARDGYEGGRAFHNAEHDLPAHDASGQPITYHEWDVNPKHEGVNRGAERLITGSDGSAYYTADHYRTFRKVR